MPNKKGSRVAASKARTQAKAKKKARQGGPVLAAAAYAPPPVAEETAEAVEEAALVASSAPAAAAAPIAPAVARRQHREPLVAHGVSLRREVGLIGVLTVAVGAALAYLKFFTDLGA